MSSQELAIRPPDAPLVTAAQAAKQWDDYMALEGAVLDEGDYLWMCSFKEGNRKRKFMFDSKEEAEEQARATHGDVSKRKIKSAFRKLARSFGFDIPDGIATEVNDTISPDEKYTIHVERGEGYSLTQWLDAQLKTVKVSVTVAIRTPQGRTWVGVGGSHISEGREDFAVLETGWTRALNRAIADALGFGDESAEETPSSEPAQSNEWSPLDVIRRRVRDYIEEHKLDPEYMRGAISFSFGADVKFADLTVEQLEELEKKLISQEEKPEITGGSGGSPAGAGVGGGGAGETETFAAPKLPVEEGPPIIVDEHGQKWDGETGAMIDGPDDPIFPEEGDSQQEQMEI